MDFSCYKRYGNKLTHSDIKEIEEAIQERLPEDYKTFLLEQGGGDIIGQTSIKFSGIDNDVLVIFGKDRELNLDPKSRDLRLGNPTFGFPERSLIVADDMGGNSYFSIFSSGEMEVRWMGYPPDAEHIHVASSFTDFLNMINVAPYDD